jgi:alpha-mannosidase
VPQPDGQTRKRAQRVLRRLIEPARRATTAPVRIEAFHVEGEPVDLSVVTAAAFEPFRVGDRWGPEWGTTWFRVTAEVPADWAGAEVALDVHLGYGGGTGFGAEGLVWRDGEPVQGISPNHREVPIVDRAAGGESTVLLIEAAANPQINPFADPAPLHLADPGGAPFLRLTSCHLVVVEREVDALRHDWSLLCELYDGLAHDTARAAQVLRALDRAANVLDATDVVATAAAARAVLAPVLAKPAHASAHRYAAVGNAHIDTAWLWPLRETVRKCARTFSTALATMDRNPDFRFAVSQAQQLAWMRDRYPAIWEGIRKRVAEGRFEVVGSMWVEADCNVPSGESLIRQIVHGRRFFRDELGVDTDNLWLPDVFGYAASLPQVLAAAGIRHFLTQKISWNQVNRFPHHTFWWEGIDGTRVFSHFPPADTYNGDFSVAQLQHGASSFAEKALCDRSMYLYGWGDGGGGPTEDMLERARRVADLEGLPMVELTGARAAFEALEAEVPGDELPVWVGELYLEMHRGTYTTHGEVKRANRTQELALRDAELWSAAAGIDVAEELDVAWKQLLLHQFHDIIPGSSIHWVYQDTADAHAAVAAITDHAIAGALGSIAARVDPGDAARPVLVANPLARSRREVVDVDGSLHLVEAPPCGWAVVDLDADAHADVPPVTAGDGWMDNGLLRVEWDGDGLLTSVRHLATGREALAPGARGNLLQVHDDRPNVYDAWDIDAVAFDTVTDLVAAESVELASGTPERAVLRVVRRLGASTIEQEVRLDRGARRVEVHCEVDWHEDHTLLKVAFPVDVHSPAASFEIQLGHVQRPTHVNTSWDEARFEVCAQTWADLSEHGFGVALLNDCKYGHDVRGNVLRLSLLRSSTWPDPVADRGTATFAYALLPHEGDVAAGGVVAEAHAFNARLRVAPVPAGGAGRDLAARRSVVAVDDPGVVLTAVKAADDGDGTIVRGYEAHGGRRTVRLAVDGATRYVPVDLLEDPVGPELAVVDGAVELALTPFRLFTLRATSGG